MASAARAALSRTVINELNVTVCEYVIGLIASLANCDCA